MNILCKFLGHDFNYEHKGILVCTRCVASVDAYKIAVNHREIQIKESNQHHDPT